MTAHDVAIAVGIVAWLASFMAPLVLPIRVDSTFSLILMASVGGLVAFREQKRETRS